MKYRIVNKKRFVVANIIGVLATIAIELSLIYVFYDKIWASLVNASTTGFFH